MSIENFFTKTATSKRLSDIEDTDKEEFSAMSGSFACHIQETDEDYSFIMEGGIKKSLKLWCGSDVDIKKGDRITIDSVEYQVFSVKTCEVLKGRNMSANKHKKCIIYLPL